MFYRKQQKVLKMLEICGFCKEKGYDKICRATFL